MKHEFCPCTFPTAAFIAVADVCTKEDRGDVRDVMPLFAWKARQPETASAAVTICVSAIFELEQRQRECGWRTASV